MAKNTKKVQAEVQVQGKSEKVDQTILRVITFIRPGNKDARYGITRSEGLVLLSLNGETLRLTCKDYYRILARVEDKKYCQLKEGHDLSELQEIRDQNKALISADLEISLNGSDVDDNWIWEFNSRYPELSRNDILKLITEFGDIETR